MNKDIVMGNANQEMNVSVLKKKERVAYLDLLKCLGMFIVVSGHIHTNYGWFSLPLHSYVIPLYFMLSGMTFRRSKYPNFGDFAKHRAKSLMLPYAMFSVVTWVFWVAYSYLTHADVASYWMPLLQTALAQGSGQFLVHNVPLWFIPSLFAIELIYYWIDKLPDWGKLASCIVLAVLGSLMIQVWRGVFILLPWSLESAFASIIFYCVGNLVVKHYGLKGLEEKVLEKKVLAIISIIVLTIILVFTSHYNDHISLGSDWLGESAWLFYFNAFVGIITISLFAILVCSINIKSKIMKSVMDYHLWFGKNSFYIMATHVPLKGIIMVIIASLIGQTVDFVGNDWVCMPIVFVITCAICSVLALFIGKLKKIDERNMARIRQK